MGTSKIWIGDSADRSKDIKFLGHFILVYIHPYMAGLEETSGWQNIRHITEFLTLLL
jgi:hypothetical protein